MNNNGTGKTELTNTTHNNYEPVFHPNGQKIFFVSERDGIAQIYSMDIDGKNQENFSKNYSFFDSSPYISDDGKILLFVRNRTYHHRSIWMKYLDGTGERQLTFYGDCYYPVFIKYLQ
jgi:Tol biopolymer transport system component